MSVIEDNKQKFLTLCRENIHRDGIEDLLGWLENETDFFTAPASTKYHGNYDGALCEHSLNVPMLAEKFAEMFGIKISKETCAIFSLHDLCKVNFYNKTIRSVKNKDTGRWEDKEVYEIDDQAPLGHGEKSCIIIQRFMQLTLPELLAIRWHMGGFDSAAKGGDYGMTKAQDMTKYVTLLQIADMAASSFLEKTIK